MQVQRPGCREAGVTGERPGSSAEAGVHVERRRCGAEAGVQGQVKVQVQRPWELGPSAPRHREPQAAQGRACTGGPVGPQRAGHHPSLARVGPARPVAQCQATGPMNCLCLQVGNLLRGLRQAIARALQQERAASEAGFSFLSLV